MLCKPSHPRCSAWCSSASRCSCRRGPLHYWQAWVFIAVFIAATMLPSIYLAVKDPAALQRRMHAGPTAETRPVQRSSSSARYSCWWRRCWWSARSTTASAGRPVPLSARRGRRRPGGRRTRARPVRRHPEQLRGGNHHRRGRAAAGHHRPVRPCAASDVRRGADHDGSARRWRSAPTGGWPWSFPRRPCSAVRILDEEKMLTEELAGYREYLQRVRYRLIPNVW